MASQVEGAAEPHRLIVELTGEDLERFVRVRNLLSADGEEAIAPAELFATALDVLDAILTNQLAGGKTYLSSGFMRSEIRLRLEGDAHAEEQEQR